MYKLGRRFEWCGVVQCKCPPWLAGSGCWVLGAGWMGDMGGVASCSCLVVECISWHPVGGAGRRHDRTQCPGCRICPVEGRQAAGARFGACSANQLNHFVNDSRLPASARPPHLCRWSLRCWAQLRFLCVSIARRPRRRIFCPHLDLERRGVGSSVHVWARQRPPYQGGHNGRELGHCTFCGVLSAVRLRLRLPSIFRRRRSFFLGFAGWA
jgi:hypothetical protein